MQRRFVVVDTETNGLYEGQHVAVDVAWWDLTTGKRGRFIPEHDWRKVVASADLDALRINRYIDWIAGQPMDVGGNGPQALLEAVDGQTLAGSNPGFDAGFLRKMFNSYERRGLCSVPVWHHRLWDLSAFAAGVLKLNHLPGLAEVCDRLNTNARPDHTAEDDVTATGECFLTLFAMAGVVL